MAKPNPKIRPGAGGHRFGPDLQCSECGRFWDAHQQDPRPCSSAARAVDVLVVAPAKSEKDAPDELDEELELP